MIRTIVMGAVASALMLSAPVAAQTGPLKLGYINSQQILSEAPGANAASQQFEQELSSMRASLQPLADEIDTLIQQYESQQLTMSEAARTQRQQTIVQKQTQLEERAQQLEVQAEQRRAALVQPVMDEINRVIEQLRVEQGYHIIFDVAAGSIITAAPELDLTDEVVRRLRAQRPAPNGGR